MTELGRPPVAELRALTSLRGIAAWWVVLYHIRLSIGGLSPFWLGVFAKGYLAVDFFFLLSGFVIWLIWHERIAEGGAVGMFLLKRVARVWPLHVLVLAGAVALALVLAASGRPNDAMFPWHELPLHVFLLQDWGFTDRLAWNDPAWSISAELAAYLMFPLMALMLDWRRVPSWLVVALVTAALIALHVSMARAGASSLGYDIARFGVPRCLAEFFAGTGLAALLLRWRTNPATPAFLAGLLGISLAMLWLIGVGTETLLVPALFASLLLVAALTAGLRGNPLEVRPLHYFGDISYATYLSHFLLFYVFKLVFVSRPGGMTTGLVALFLAVVLVVSIALYHGFERPAQRWVIALARRPARVNRPVRSPAHPEAPR